MKVNTLKTKSQDRGHSGIPTDLCTREPGSRDRGTVSAFIRIQTEIDTRGSGKRTADTDKESISTRIKVLDTRVGIGGKPGSPYDGGFLGLEHWERNLK